MERSLGGAIVLLNLALAAVQLVAFAEGFHVWTGWAWWIAVPGFVAISAVPLGYWAITALAFYGAIMGFGLVWWQAALLCFPYLILSLIVVGVGNGWQAYTRYREKSSG